MKKVIRFIIIIFLLVGTNLIVYSQHLVFHVKKIKEETVDTQPLDTIVMYVNIDNVIDSKYYLAGSTSYLLAKRQGTVSIAKFPLKVTNGTISIDENGKPSARFNRVGYNTLSRVEKNGKTDMEIKVATLIVKPIPKIFSTLVLKSGGEITLKEILDSPFIKLNCGVSEINKQIIISSFGVSVSLGVDSFPLFRVQNSNKLSNQILDVFKQLNKTSTFIIEDIRYKLPDGTENTLPVMTFKLKGRKYDSVEDIINESKSIKIERDSPAIKKEKRRRK
jgi:hypothetical protein